LSLAPVDQVQSHPFSLLDSLVRMDGPAQSLSRGQGTSSMNSTTAFQVECDRCGKEYTRRGLPTHQRACKGQFNAASLSLNPVPQLPPTSPPPPTSSHSQTKSRVTRHAPKPSSLPAKEFGELLASLKATVPTLRRVPRGARMQVAHAMAATIDAVVQDNSEDAWQRLGFPLCHP